MSTIKYLILICVLVLSSLSELPAQEKITLETTRFPAGFDGHNPAMLFDNLKTLLEQNKAGVKNAETAREILKGKSIYQNLTTDDLFAFTISPAKYVSGRNRETGIRYRGEIFRLKSLQEFPPPGERYRDSGGGSGDGSKEPEISSTKDLVSEFITTKPLEEWWAASYLPILTIYPREANSKEYVGYKPECRPLPSLPGVKICSGVEFFVPSPQIHYGLSFAGKQPFQTVELPDHVLSLETYSTERRSGAGIVAWLRNGEPSGAITGDGIDTGRSDRINPALIFIVSLVSPYAGTETFETPDAMEQKPHRAIRNLIQTKLIAIWIYDRRSGRIFSKHGDKPDEPLPVSDQNAFPTPFSEKLKILSLPPAVYTAVARQKGVMGIVTLKVTFLASGQIGAVIVVKGLPHGLTEMAQTAARRIKFIPAKIRDVPSTVTKTMEFNFTLY